MEEITVSEQRERSSYIIYLYNALSESLLRAGGNGELLFRGERNCLRIQLPSGAERLRLRIADKIGEVIGAIRCGSVFPSAKRNCSAPH